MLPLNTTESPSATRSLISKSRAGTEDLQTRNHSLEGSAIGDAHTRIHIIRRKQFVDKVDVAAAQNLCDESADDDLVSIGGHFKTLLYFGGSTVNITLLAHISFRKSNIIFRVLRTEKIGILAP